MKKCVILDDEENCRIALRELIRRLCPDMEIILESDDALLVHRLISEGRIAPDLVFLDIQMPGCDGFEFLGKFSEIPFQLIFTTAYDRHAIRAIRFAALDYLLKPIDAEELATALERFRNSAKLPGNPLAANLKSRISEGNLLGRLAIASQVEINFIETQSIIYFESSSNYTTVHLEGGQKIISSKNIGYYEELLEGTFFCRIHNSYIINMQKLKKYIRGKAGSVEMDNGTQLAISMRRKETFLALMGRV